MLCDTKLFTSPAIFFGGYLSNDSFSFFFRESRQLHNQCIDFPEAGRNSDCELIRAAETLWLQAELWCSYADLLIVSRTLFFCCWYFIFSSWQARRCGAFIRITCIQYNMFTRLFILLSIKRKKDSCIQFDMFTACISMNAVWSFFVLFIYCVCFCACVYCLCGGAWSTVCGFCDGQQCELILKHLVYWHTFLSLDIHCSRTLYFGNIQVLFRSTFVSF